MGLKDRFKRKEPTEDDIRQHLSDRGITQKNNSFGGRQEKFGAFKQYAQERANQKPGLQPVNPYANLQGNGNGNPYATNGDLSNPYAGGGEQGQGQSQGQGQGNPYSTPSAGASARNPYGSSASTSTSATGASGATDPYKARDPYSSNRDPYAGTNTYARSNTARTSVDSDPYGGTTARNSMALRRPRDFDEESLDLNAIPSNTMYQGKKPINKKAYDNESVDLNDVPDDEEDLNIVLDELPEEQEVNSEDEEVEAIKQDIRFTKQESVALTRNTLRMAQEADASGTNTMGMLGSQSERLYNSEQNLQLADTQTNIASEQVKQINRLNRSIFIPASGNPFNKKSRMRMQEQKIKTEKAQEKYLRDTNRKNMYESEQRLKQGITQNATGSELHQKYLDQKNLQNAQRYQFENDSEDDEMEKEIANNLDQIALYSKKLKNTAKTMGTEVESQNERLRKIEEDADRLDINVHLNNTRLSHIR